MVSVYMWKEWKIKVITKELKRDQVYKKNTIEL